MSVQMLIWSQTAGSRRRVCAAHRRASTTLPVCQRETTLSAGTTLAMGASPDNSKALQLSLPPRMKGRGEAASLFYHPVFISSSFVSGSEFSALIRTCVGKKLNLSPQMTDFDIIIKSS